MRIILLLELSYCYYYSVTCFFVVVLKQGAVLYRVLYQIEIQRMFWIAVALQT